MFKPCGGSSNFRRLLKFYKFLKQKDVYIGEATKTGNCCQLIIGLFQESRGIFAYVRYYTYNSKTRRENVHTRQGGTFHVSTGTTVQRQHYYFGRSHNKPGPDGTGYNSYSTRGGY